MFMRFFGNGKNLKLPTSDARQVRKSKKLFSLEAAEPEEDRVVEGGRRRRFSHRDDGKKVRRIDFIARAKTSTYRAEDGDTNNEAHQSQQ